MASILAMQVQVPTNQFMLPPLLFVLSLDMLPAAMALLLIVNNSPAQAKSVKTRRMLSLLTDMTTASPRIAAHNRSRACRLAPLFLAWRTYAAANGGRA